MVPDRLKQDQVVNNWKTNSRHMRDFTLLVKIVCGRILSCSNVNVYYIIYVLFKKNNG